MWWWGSNETPFRNVELDLVQLFSKVLDNITGFLYSVNLHSDSLNIKNKRATVAVKYLLLVNLCHYMCVCRSHKMSCCEVPGLTHS